MATQESTPVRDSKQVDISNKKVHDLDAKHGIDEIVEEGQTWFYPWYRKHPEGVSHYYTIDDNWDRVRCTEYDKAYNHIARSLRWPTRPREQADHRRPA